MSTRILISVFIFAIIGAIWSCVTAPETGRKQLVLLPEGQMNSLGAQAYSEIESKYKVLPDGALTKAINEIATKLTKASGKKLDWQVKVFKSDQVNAFCLPGGKIGVFTGILKVASTNAGLAAIIGHEIAHATAHHGAERMSQALLVQGAVAAADISLKDQKYRSAILGAMGVGLQIGVLLPYSRTQESEADHIGTLYMSNAGYDPQAAVKVWEEMAKQQKARSSDFLSTHPNPVSRAKFLEKHMSEYLQRRSQSKLQVQTIVLPEIN